MAPRQPYRQDGDGPSRPHGGDESQSIWHDEWIGGDCYHPDGDDDDDYGGGESEPSYQDEPR